MWRQSSTLSKITFVLAILLIVSLAWKSGGPRPKYISDMDFNVLGFEWKEPKLDQSIDSNPILINEKHYDKGLGVHARTEISVNVPYGYTHFAAEVGVDDEVPNDSPATVRFVVLGDGAVLWKSPVITASDAPRRVLVNVSDRVQLTLLVLPTDDGTNSDHADWGAARFIRQTH